MASQNTVQLMQERNTARIAAHQRLNKDTKMPEAGENRAERRKNEYRWRLRPKMGSDRMMFVQRKGQAAPSKVPVELIRKNGNLVAKKTLGNIAKNVAKKFVIQKV